MDIDTLFITLYYRHEGGNYAIGAARKTVVVYVSGVAVFTLGCDGIMVGSGGYYCTTVMDDLHDHHIPLNVHTPTPLNWL